MKTILTIILALGLAGTGWANHLSVQIETTECAERNHYCGQTLGHDSPTLPQVDEPRSNTLGPYYAGEAEKAQKRYNQCEQRMEAAMRAMERYRERKDSWVTIGDATSTITWPGYITPVPMPACCDDLLHVEMPPPTLEEKIEALEQDTMRKIRDMKKAAAKAEEERGQRIVNDSHRKWAYQEWDAVKASCWRRP